MTRAEYIKYFNSRQPENQRKITEKALFCFEKKLNYTEEYHRHIELFEKVRTWIQSKNDNEWLKISGQKGKRNRPSYDFYVHTVKIIAKPLTVKPSFPFGEKLIGRSANRNLWAYAQINKTYFTEEIIFSDFLDLNLDKNNDEQKIIGFMEKYGVPFIENKKTDLTESFLEEYQLIKKIISLLKNKQFPYKKITPAKINKFIEITEEIIEPQVAFINRTNKRKNPIVENREKTANIFDYYDYPIHLIYDYLWINKKLTKCPICNKYFWPTRKNIKGCCPQHSNIIRKRKFNEKKKKL